MDSVVRSCVGVMDGVKLLRMLVILQRHLLLVVQQVVRQVAALHFADLVNKYVLAMVSVVPRFVGPKEDARNLQPLLERWLQLQLLLQLRQLQSQRVILCPNQIRPNQRPSLSPNQRRNLHLNLCIPS